MYEQFGTIAGSEIKLREHEEELLNKGFEVDWFDNNRKIHYYKREHWYGSSTSPFIESQRPESSAEGVRTRKRGR